MPLEPNDKRIICPSCSAVIDADKLTGSFFARTCPRCGGAVSAEVLFRAFRFTEPRTSLAQRCYYATEWYQQTHALLDGEGLDGKAYRMEPVLDLRGALQLRAAGSGEPKERGALVALRFQAFRELQTLCAKVPGSRLLANLVVDWQPDGAPAGHRKWGRADAVLLTPSMAFVVEVLAWPEHVMALDSGQAYYRCNWDDDPYSRDNPYLTSFDPAAHGFVRSGSAAGIRELAAALAPELPCYQEHQVKAVTLFVGTKSFVGGTDGFEAGYCLACLDEEGALSEVERLAASNPQVAEGALVLLSERLWTRFGDLDGRRSVLRESWRDGNQPEPKRAKPERPKERPKPQEDGSFSDGTFSGERFSDLRFVGARFANMEVTDCIFENCTLEDCRFDSCTISSCEFSSCTIVNPRTAHCAMTAAGFRDSQLVGIQWSVLANDVFSGPIEYLIDTLVKYGVFDVMDLAKMDFTRAELAECSFNNCDLREANLRAAQLSGTQFANCDLRKADFRFAQGYHVDAPSCRLAGTRFSLPEATCLIESLGAKVE
jgi:uncharacterized protein YjbI with pentapeptide repeats